MSSHIKNMITDLITTKNVINYDKIISECEIYISNDEKTDINFIVPVRHRFSFSKPLYDSFKNARDNVDLKISFTIVELSAKSEHKNFCVNNGINYIWYKTKEDEPFNKCLGLNLGVFLSNKSNSFLFHDIDCLIQSDFFVKLKENINKKNAKAIQTFHGRRVLYLNQKLTNLILNGALDVDTLHFGYDGVTPPFNVGAPGGSIYIEKDLFFQIGGYDPEFFYGYAPEDIFFWKKVELFEVMHISDDPKIDIFHMNHKLTSGTNPDIDKMHLIHVAFNELPERHRKDLIKIKENAIKKFYYE